jgi:hypothetical protein
MTASARLAGVVPAASVSTSPGWPADPACNGTAACITAADITHGCAVLWATNLSCTVQQLHACGLTAAEPQFRRAYKRNRWLRLLQQLACASGRADGGPAAVASIAWGMGLSRGPSEGARLPGTEAYPPPPGAMYFSRALRACSAARCARYAACTCRCRFSACACRKPLAVWQPETDNICIASQPTTSRVKLQAGRHVPQRVHENQVLHAYRSLLRSSALGARCFLLPVVQVRAQ